MTSKELTEQGVAALKEGDKSRAHDLLQQAVELDPNNAKAWFFLSRVQTSVAEKRASLNTVLAIMPDNKLAQEALEKLPPEDIVEEEEDFSVFEENEPNTRTTSSTSSSAPDSYGIGEGTKPKIGGFALPVAIPDAPEEVEPKTIIDDFVQTFKNGIEILRRTPGIYPMEIQRATWWRFWQFAVVAWIISGIASAISGAIAQAQLAAMFSDNPFVSETIASPNIITILVTMIISIPLGIIVLYAGLYASHRFVTGNRNGQGSFVSHSYTIMIPVVTASIITNVATLVFSFIPFLSGLISIAAIVFWFYSMYIAAQGVSIVHKVDTNSGYWTVGVMVLVQFLTGFVIGLILSPFILSAGMMGFI